MLDEYRQHVILIVIQVESQDQKMNIPFDLDTSSPLINMKINGQNKLFQVCLGTGFWSF